MITKINNWQTAKLSDVTDYINRGISPVYTQDNSIGTTIINQKCIRDGVVNPGFSKLTDETIKQIPRDKLIQPYDILINSTGTGTVGRVAQIMDLTKRATVDSHVTIVRPKKKTIDPKYLGYWLKIKQDELEALASGSTNQVELSRTKIADLNVIVPPIKTQEKISEIIAAIDSSIKSTTRLIQKNELIKKGLMQELFIKGIDHTKFKKTKLGEIPNIWDINSLGAISKVMTGKTPSRTKPEYFRNGTIPWVKSTEIRFGEIYSTEENITEAAVKTESMKIISKNSVLIAMYGQGVTRGKSAILRCSATTNQAIAAVSEIDKNIDILFLFYFLQSKYLNLRDLGHGGNQKNLNSEIIKSILIPIPDKNEQEKIAEILSEVDEKIAVNKKMKEKLLLLKKGLMQDIFSGKVEIINAK